MDKAERYVDKAIVQISKTRTQTGESPLLSSFHVMLIEHMIQCRLVTGNKAKAVTELGLLTKLLSSNTMLLQHHRAQLHTLLGLYAMSMSCMEAAESQFNCALRTSKERELWTFSNLNLAIVYLRQRRDRDFMALLDRISPDQLPSASHCMKAAAYYIHGLQSFFSSQYGESKRYLRETLKMANQEDLNRLTSCSLVLLGHIFLSLNNPKESMNMVTPAMQLAGKIPDVNVQLWATAILKVKDCRGMKIFLNTFSLSRTCTGWAETPRGWRLRRRATLSSARSSSRTILTPTARRNTSSSTGLTGPFPNFNNNLCYKTMYLIYM